MKQNVNKKLNKTNVKRVALGTVGVVSTAGAVFGFTTLLNNKDSEKNYLKATSNSLTSWTPMAPTNNGPASSMSAVLTDAQRGHVSISQNQNTNIADIGIWTVTNNIGHLATDTTAPKTLRRLVTQIFNDFKGALAKPTNGQPKYSILGLKEHPRLVLETQKLYDAAKIEALDDFKTMHSNSDVHFSSDQVVINYVIEGQENTPFAVDKNLPYVDLDLTTWFTNHPASGAFSFPKITFYAAIANSNIGKSAFGNRNNDLINTVVEIPGEVYSPKPNEEVQLHYTPWSMVAENKATFVPADMPVITFDASHNVVITDHPIDASKHYQVKYSFSDRPGFLYTRAQIDDMIANHPEQFYEQGREYIASHIIPEPGYIFLPSELTALTGLEVVTAEHDINPGTWYTPAVARQIEKITNYPLPTFDNVADIPLPTFTMTNSKDYSITKTFNFGIDYKFALSGGRKWDGVNDEISVDDFNHLKAAGKLPNLYDWTTKTWTDVIVIATPKSASSKVHERREPFTRTTGAKGIISKAELPNGVISLMATISGADSATHTTVDRTDGTALTSEYSIDNGVTWLTKAQLDALNLFNPKVYPFFPLYILQRVKITETDVAFDQEISSVVLPLDSNAINYAGITSTHPYSQTEIYFAPKVGITKMVLPDEFNPTIDATSTSGDWQFGSFGFPNASPTIDFEYTFDDNWNNPSNIFVSSNKQQMDKLKAMNFYDFTNSKFKTLHWRIKDGSLMPMGYSFQTKSDTTYAPQVFSALSYADKTGDITMDPTTKITIKKADLESGAAYALFRPTIVGTTSKFVINEPTIPGITYKYKIDGSSESYVDKATFLADPNHADLLDTATGRIKGIDYQVTTSGNIFIVDAAAPTQVVEGLKESLIDISIVPHIALNGTSEDWEFIKGNNNPVEYEFTFLDDWALAESRGQIYSQSITNTNTGVLSSHDYVNKAGAQLSTQNLYNFLRGSFGSLHWRIKGATTLDSTNSGVSVIPANFPVEITGEKLRKLFPIYDGISHLPLPNTSRIDPIISGNANHFALRDGEALLPTNQYQVHGFHIVYKIDSEPESQWKAMNDFKSSHADLTDFSDPLNPKIKNVVWKLVPDAGSTMSITYPTVFAGWPVAGNDQLIATQTIHVLTPGTNLKLVPTAKNIDVQLNFNQEHPEKVQLYVATDQDITGGKIHWVKLEEALNNRMTFFGQRGAALLTTLYWKAEIIDIGGSGGYRIDPSQATPVDPSQGTYGEFGKIDLKWLRYLTTELPTEPTIATDATTNTNPVWNIQIPTGTHYDYLFQLEDETTDSTGNPIWLTYPQFIQKYRNVLWDKATNHVKVNWSASLSQSYRFDGMQDSSKTHGQVELKIGAEVIKVVTPPTIDWKDVVGRPTTTSSTTPVPQHYTDSYSLHEELNGAHMHYEYSISGSSDWMSQHDFEAKYKNLYTQGNGVEGKMYDIFWRVIPDDGVIFDALVTRQGKITIPHTWHTDNGVIVKVVNHVMATWNALDSVSAYTLKAYSDDRSTTYSYQTTSVINDPNSPALMSDEFMKAHTPLVQEVKTHDADGNVVSEVKLIPIYYVPQAAPGYYFADYNEGLDLPIEIVVTATPVPKPVVLASGAVIWPIGWVHDDKYGVYIEPNHPDGTLSEIWYQDPSDHKWKEITQPTTIQNRVWFPDTYTYEKATNEFHSPDGSETWVQEPTTHVWHLLKTGGDSSDSSSMPIWEIAVIAAGGALTLGVGGFFLYRYIKRKKMDY